MEKSITTSARVGRGARVPGRVGALTKLAGAEGLVLVRVRTAGARAGLGLQLGVPGWQRLRGPGGLRGGARPVRVGVAGGARGLGPRSPRARAPRDVLGRGRAVLRLNEARAGEPCGRARRVPEAGAVVSGRRGLPAPGVGPSARACVRGSRPARELGQRLRARLRRLPGAWLSVRRRGCGRERGGEPGGGATGAEEARSEHLQEPRTAGPPPAAAPGLGRRLVAGSKSIWATVSNDRKNKQVNPRMELRNFIKFFQITVFYLF